MPGENIKNLLNDPLYHALWENTENAALRNGLLEIIDYCERHGKTLLFQIQSGALAPVQSCIDAWKEAGLAGCTGELVAAQALRNETTEMVTINTMTAAEQAAANTTLREKGVKLGLETPMLYHFNLILNDPHRILATLFNLEVVKVAGRYAYRPETLILTWQGDLHSRIKNQSRTAPRDTTAYFTDIREALKTVPLPTVRSPIEYYRFPPTGSLPSSSSSSAVSYKHEI